MTERIRAVYRVRCAAAEVEARARAIAAEQSVELPPAAVRDAWVAEHVLGRVESIEPEASDGATGDATGRATTEAAADGPSWRVTIGLSALTVDGDPGQLLNMLFGNTSLQPDVELLDADLPPSLLEALPGPRHGIAGLRALTRVPRRALTCTALKPQGLSAPALAELAGRFAAAGIDVVKDDHGIADQRYAPFRERVPRVQEAIERAHRGRDSRTLYAPSLSGGPMEVAEQLRLAHREGVRCVLACPMVLGVPAFVELVRGHGDFAVIAHPALAGAARIAPPLLLGRLFRLFGADATIFPNFGGRFSYDRDTCAAIAQGARAPLGKHPPAMPVPAGGMHTGRVEEMLEAFGRDVMLLIGGHLLEAGDAMPARAREFVERVRRAERADAPA